MCLVVTFLSSPILVLAYIAQCPRISSCFFPIIQTRRCVCFVLLRSATRGPAQLSFRPMLDSPNNSPLLTHASKALMDSRKPAKVTRPPSPALATATGMNLSHKPSVSRRESSATTCVPSAKQKHSRANRAGHRYIINSRRQNLQINSSDERWLANGVLAMPALERNRFSSGVWRLT